MPPNNEEETNLLPDEYPNYKTFEYTYDSSHSSASDSDNTNDEFFVDINESLNETESEITADQLKNFINAHYLKTREKTPAAVYGLFSAVIMELVSAAFLAPILIKDEEAGKTLITGFQILLGLSFLMSIGAGYTIYKGVNLYRNSNSTVNKSGHLVKEEQFNQAKVTYNVALLNYVIENLNNVIKTYNKSCNIQGKNKIELIETDCIDISPEKDKKKIFTKINELEKTGVEKFSFLTTGFSRETPREAQYMSGDEYFNGVESQSLDLVI